MMKLYPHQKKQAKAVRKELKKSNHVLFGLATGGGKSIVMLDFIDRYLEAGKKVLVLAPFRKLIFQLEDTFSKYEPHVIMGSIDRGNERSGLVLSSIQTTNARLRREKHPYENIDVIIIDEAHISGNFPPLKTSQFKTLYDMYWRSAKWIGFSATPITAKGHRLEGWDKSVYKYQTASLIRMGYLADYDYYAPEQIDVSKLRVSSTGEFVAEDIEEVTLNATAVKAVKKQYLKHKHKKMIVFASSIEHAKLLKEELKHSNVIHSAMAESSQNEILANYKRAESGALINVGMLTTGFDDPTVEVLILARPVKSVRLFMQICGRVLRKHGDKRATILDMCSCYETCGLPKDVRDFNKVKGDPIEKDVLEVGAIKCRGCLEVFPFNETKRKKKITKKLIKTKIYCPHCGELIDEKIDKLSAPKIVKIEEEELEPLSYKERREVINNLIVEFTSKKISWGYFILRYISETDRDELLDQAIRKGTTNRTLWKKIMTMVTDAKRELNV